MDTYSSACMETHLIACGLEKTLKFYDNILTNILFSKYFVPELLVLPLFLLYIRFSQTSFEILRKKHLDIEWDLKLRPNLSFAFLNAPSIPIINLIHITIHC